MRAPRGLAAAAVLACLVGLAGTPAPARASTAPGAQPSPVVTTVRVPKHHGPVVQTTLTTSDEHYALRSMPAQYFVRQTNRRPVVQVNDRVRYQRILGFGGAMTDSSAWLIQRNLTSWQRNRILHDLFSPVAGIGLSVTRVPIGASDFSATGVPYSYDDLPAGQTDQALAHFSIAHDLGWIIPALTEMLALNPQIKVLSTEWSPPVWMKANGRFDDLKGTGTLLPSDYGALADYFVKFISAYRAAGIPIWAVTPENEPLSWAAFPAMNLPSAQEAEFIDQDLGPALARSGLHTQIFGMDGSSVAYAQSLEQSSAAGTLAGMAWHCYGGQQSIGQFHALYPHVVNLTSECSPGITPYGASEAALSGLNNFSSLIQLWNLALDTHGGPVQAPNTGCTRCTGLVTVNTTTRRATLRLNYYELGQFSKFILPGAVRVAATRLVTEFRSPTPPRYGVTHGLDDVAAVDPNGRRVLVVYNNSGLEQYFDVKWRRQLFPYKLPPRATVTFTWAPAASGGVPTG